MDRKIAHKIILESARIYNENLAGNNFLIVFEEGKYEKFIEVIFEEANFAHLTGVNLNKISPKEYLNLAVRNELSLSNYGMKKDGTTVCKLEVIKKLMEFPMKFSMIGEYNNNGYNLFTEKLAGNVVGMIGFIKYNENYYVPNTLLKGDIRQNVIEVSKIKAVYIKNKFELYYNQKPKYVSKDLIHNEQLKWKNANILKKISNN